jgi:hypothetical protein
MEVLWGVIQDGGALGCDSGWKFRVSQEAIILHAL